MAAINFNAEEIEPQADFAPIPVGEYTVIISASEMKDNAKGTGKYLQIIFDVVEGQYKGRKVFDILNIQNANETAQQIAQRALSSICRAVGVMHPTDSEELHNIPLLIKVGIRPANEKYEESNIVKGYAACKTTAPEPGKKPWQK